MHRFFLPPEQYAGETISLIGREAKHAVQVLRLRRGSICAVLNGAGEEWACEFDATSKSEVRLRVLRRTRHEPTPWRLTLYQALPKGRLIETIIRKATELGVARIVPFLSERVVSQLDVECSAVRVERWKQSAIEAVKQCGCPWLPSISAPLPFESALSEVGLSELPLVASLQSDRRHICEVVREFAARQHRKPASASLWVGPEGDFTPAELSAIRQAGAYAIALGPYVLRADTAAIAGLSITIGELWGPRE